ncbi:MAG: DUF192 domain-containing protein [Solirubrobacterales bacterium]
MVDRRLAPRLRRLPVDTVLGRQVPVAVGFRARLLGLAHLERDKVGAGLLIPGCSSVHTFRMRFALDLYFLDERLSLLAVRRGIPARRVVFHWGAGAVLEIPAGEGGEFSSPRP